MERILKGACSTTPRIPLLVSIYHLTHSLPLTRLHNSSSKFLGESSMLNGACGSIPRIPLLVSTTHPPSLPHLFSCFFLPGVPFLTAACAET